MSGANLFLGGLPRHRKVRSRSISAENPTGAVGAGGQAENYMGVGRKGRAFYPLPSGTTLILADIEGPGAITHIWITVREKSDVYGRAHLFILRDLILRMTWDDADVPSVETPLGDFFCNGLGRYAPIAALPISVNAIGGFNCYFRMPFQRRAKIEIVSQHQFDLPHFFFQISYEQFDEPEEDAGYFHARWARSNPNPLGVDHTLLETTGQGQYVGTYLAWTPLGPFWWGEGEMKFYMDGDTDFPTICGTGTEDYVGGAWCFHPAFGEEPVNYNTPFLGYQRLAPREHWSLPGHSMYRFHVTDPIYFEESLRVTIQVIGADRTLKYERSDDVSSVAYWYQTPQAGPWAGLPAATDRWPR